MINQFLKTNFQQQKILDTEYNAKISEIEGNILSITGLATTSPFNTVENKIRDVSNLFKKADYDAKISDIESKHI